MGYSSQRPRHAIFVHSLQRATGRERHRASVGSTGDTYDNALAESINGLFKAEVIHRRGPWRNVEAVEFATLAWVDWFNNRRLLEPIGDIPPIEFEQAYYRQREAHAQWRDSHKTVSENPGAVQGVRRFGIE